MESQLQRPHDHTYDDPQNASAAHSMVEDEGEHHLEKKSMLNRVKAKAKKIKDTLKKHGYGHEPDHEHENDYHHDESRDDEDEEDEDEDEEMVEDPEIHGAPAYESAAIRSAVPSQNINLEKPTAMGEDRYATDQVVDRPALQGKSAVPSQRINLEKPTALEEDRYDSKSSDRVVARPAVQGQSSEKPTAMEEDRYDTKSSDRVVASRAVQGQEQYSGQSGTNLEKPTLAGIAQAPEDKNMSLTPDVLGTRPNFTEENVEKVQNQGNRIGELEHLKKDPNYAQPGTILASNYETTVTDPTGKGGEGAQMTPPLIQSLDKMSVFDESVPKPERQLKQGDYTGSHDQFAPQPSPTADEFAPKPLTTSSDRGSSESITKSYNPSKPEELPRDTLMGKSPKQSGYIEKISTATSALANRAISAKNIIASTLGYGGNEDAKGQEMGEGEEGVKSASPTGYAQKVAATETERLAPVYGKVADAGSSVISKVKGSTTNAGKDEQPELKNEGEGKVAEKGVSVKEFLSEKLKPSEEDKALSEVISETLHMKKEEIGKTMESKPIGKATESEEVARRLGSETEQRREEDDAIAAGSESTGKGVVNRIKDAVNLWVAKGGQDQHSK